MQDYDKEYPCTLEDAPIADGIYFHMPEDQYHALDRLSGSGLKQLKVSALQYYAENYDETFVRRETLAMTGGSAYHKRILEGREAFIEAYVPALQKSDIEGALDSQQDLKDFCSAHDLAVSGTKPVLSERIVNAIPEMRTRILAYAQEEFNRVHARQIQISRSEFDQIEKSASILEASDLSMVFSEGFPEVVILWTDEKTDVKCKARIDYLRHDLIAELKTFSNAQRKPVERCVSSAIAYEGYNISAVHYMNGLQAVKKLLKKGNANIDFRSNEEVPVYHEFIDLLISNVQEFVFVFQESGQVGNCLARMFSQKSSGMDNNYWHGTQDMILDLMTKYKSFMKTHGRERPWIEHQEAVTLDDSDFPLWMIE